MADTDEPIVTRSDLIGWTPKMVFYNTLGTIIGGVAGVASLILSAIALIIVLS